MRLGMTKKLSHLDGILIAVTSHQTLVTSYQSPFTSHQSSVIRHVIRYQLQVVSHQSNSSCKS